MCISSRRLSYNIIGTIGKTNPGDTPQPTGSARSAESRGESAVFFLDAATFELSQIWVEDDGTSLPGTPYFQGSSQSGYFMAATNEAVFEAQFPDAVQLIWYLEEVTP
ncbi:hypothetical protein M408DRAFT_203046 [Serendipita vermifera MAFF 305830]|uniref:Uncharacterized protein n=1 Tax=Serendipita vermifera MAFF 305830 TaxID=933852 RepID=A0A0C2X9Q9_SERVB|nr:hypothetical protein M408DRAFT_203046 [Serendipita vermifera MAFF 305830]